MAETHVQVQFEEGGRLYTYLDTSGVLQVGDQVELDPDKGDNRVVTVVSQEHGGWQGELKTISSKPINVKSEPV